MKIGDGSYDFAKHIRMIDDMIGLLGKERADNDEENEYCEADLATAEDKLKELKHTIANLERDIADGVAICHPHGRNPAGAEQQGPRQGRCRGHRTAERGERGVHRDHGRRQRGRIAPSVREELAQHLLL